MTLQYETPSMAILANDALKAEAIFATLNCTRPKSDEQPLTIVHEIGVDDSDAEAAEVILVRRHLMGAKA